MCDVLIFAGTTEGRELAVYLAKRGISVLVSVATEYGELILLPHLRCQVHTGRLQAEEMRQLAITNRVKLVVDATHPYATQATEQINQAFADGEIPCFRLVREQYDLSKKEQAVYAVADAGEAAAYLGGTRGNILLTTGSKELSSFKGISQFEERIYVRVLPSKEALSQCEEAGIASSHIIAMQGPFSKELNQALLQQYHIQWLVTKESGRLGGLSEKLEAAEELGVSVVVIGRPHQEKGYSLSEMKEKVLDSLGCIRKQKVILAGVGMGTLDTMTLQCQKACKEADVLLGAGRMAEFASLFGKPFYPAYTGQQVKKLLSANPKWSQVVVLLSGDSGCYSGAKTLRKELEGIELEGKEPEGIEVEQLPGISTLSYFASRIGVSWEQMGLVSVHGRAANLLSAVSTREWTFVLLGGENDGAWACKRLVEYGYGNLLVWVGEQLSYPEERIVHGTASQLSTGEYTSLSAMVIHNPDAEKNANSFGRKDEDYIRGKVPMTKEEIRCLSVRKLAPRADGIIYDIGAGTGGVTVELGMAAPDGCVYALEKKEEAVSLILQNKKKFGLEHIQVVLAEAPEGMEELPPPDCVFIGGSSGKLSSIIREVLKKNPFAKMVINAITVETTAQVFACIQEFDLNLEDMITVTVARAKETGSYHMMMGENPVTIFTCCGKPGK